MNTVEDSNEPTRWESFKEHVSRNRYRYAAGGLVVLGSVVGYAVGRSVGVAEGCGDVFELSIDGDENSHIHLGDGDSIETHTTNNYYGHSTKIVKCLETGEVFETVSAASEAAGVGRTTMSKHLNGRQDHVNGYHYEIIGQGTTGV